MVLLAVLFSLLTKQSTIHFPSQYTHRIASHRFLCICWISMFRCCYFCWFFAFFFHSLFIVANTHNNTLFNSQITADEQDWQYTAINECGFKWRTKKMKKQKKAKKKMSGIQSIWAMNPITPFLNCTYTERELNHYYLCVVVFFFCSFGAIQKRKHKTNGKRLDHTPFLEWWEPQDHYPSKHIFPIIGNHHGLGSWQKWK